MQKLKKGDTVAITATSSPCSQEKLTQGITYLQSLGLEVIVFESCRQTHKTKHSPVAYLAGDDNLRLSNLHSAFENKKIKAVFTARGGYGSARLLPYINYDLIKKNPKLFLGFSDTTALHIAFNQLCCLPTYHAPMPAANLNASAHPLTLQSFCHMVFEDSPSPSIRVKTKTIIHGNATGILTGGNLSLIASLLGTPFEIDTKDKILFLEEINEEPYKIDRLFLQLKQAGKFSDAAGIILGSFSPETPKTLEQAIQELIIPENKPTISNMPCGHTSPTLTLPLGTMVSLHQLQKYGHFGM